MAEEKALPESEIWDDTSLLASWDEALEEYKKYHSMAAKGEKVQVGRKTAAAAAGDLKQGAVSQLDGKDDETDSAAAAAAAAAGGGGGGGGGGGVDDLRAGKAAAAAAAVDADAASFTPPTVQARSTLDMPRVLAGSSVRDESMKNIMMSWYYAGYYTGLYEGKQQAYAEMEQRHDG